MSEAQFYRFGALCAIVGGVLALVTNALHPRIDEFSDPIAAELQMVSESGAWIPVHLGIAAGTVLIVAGLYVFARSLREDGGGYRLGRLALGSLVISAPVALAAFAVDGYATKEVADTWAAASGGEAKQIAAASGRAVGDIGWGLFMFTLMTLLGLTPALFGVATARSREYPAFLGWPVVVIAVASIVVGLLGTIDGPSSTFFLAFTVTSGLLTLWAIVAGIFLWRRAPAATG